MDPCNNPFSPSVGTPPPELVGKDPVLQEAASEKNFLRAMTELGPSSRRTGDIGDILHSKISSLAPVRAKLIKKGMIYSPAHGELAFTVPLFNEFMIRAIPNLK